MDAEGVAATYRRYKSVGVCQEIASRDEMWASGAEWYFAVGKSALDAILAALTHAPIQSVDTILDLPCGHGRVARHLRAAFPDARISYCDLSRSGVDFCCQTFGGEGIYSQPDLLGIRLGNYDLIWVGSLFTHLTFRRSAAWLAWLCTHINPGGVIVATFHGRWSLETQKRFPMISAGRFRKARFERMLRGWGYASYPGARHGEYGISLSTPSKVLELASTIPGVRILSYTERGWADNHDVLALGRVDRLKPWT